jgi:hypothetical protein
LWGSQSWLQPAFQPALFVWRRSSPHGTQDSVAGYVRHIEMKSFIGEPRASG